MSARGTGPSRIGSRITVAALTVAAAVLVTAAGFAWAPHGVTVVVDGSARTYLTRATTVGALLAERGLAATAADLVSPPATAKLTDRVTVVVRHPVPVTVAVGGRIVPLRVFGRTVRDALVAAGLGPGDGLLVKPAVDTALHPGLAIRTADHWVIEAAEPYPVAFHTLVKEDDKLPVGSRRVAQEGRLGRGERVYRIEMRRGREQRRALKADQVVLAPIEKIVLVGTDTSPAEIGSYTRSTIRTASFSTPRPSLAPPPTAGTRVTVLATAYSAGHDSGDYTATGLLCRFGVIAVDPRVIPLGTRLYVPGYGYGLAADTGGAIKGRHVDVCFDHESECDDWGRRTLTVTIIR